MGSFYQPRYIGQGMVSYGTDGVFNRPTAVTGDGTNIYVADIEASRILKFNAATGAFIGWVGAISGSPTGNGPGVAGCVGATGNTPGWCTGGSSTYGSGNGQLYYPSGITYAAGNIYVVDTYNQRVVSFNATSGAYNGWIGRVNTGTPTGCTVHSNGAVNVSMGWCVGGTSAATNPDRGGAFSFWLAGTASRTGIYSDGAYLYITNFYNYRIDKWSLTGQFQGAAPTRTNTFTNTWINLADPTSTSNGTDPNRTTLYNATNGWGCDYPFDIFVDGTHIYGITNWFCSGGQSAVWKMNKTTGTMVGWKGGISFSTPPTGGEGSCSGATGVTPGWCTGGAAVVGYTLGYFSGDIAGIAGDAHYVYVTDRGTHRMTRLPK
jgi:hypothetical protein